MDKKKVRLLVKNLEVLVETLKYELESDETQTNISNPLGDPEPVTDMVNNIEFRAAPRRPSKPDWDDQPVDNTFVVPITDYDEVFDNED